MLLSCALEHIQLRNGAAKRMRLCIRATPRNSYIFLRLSRNSMMMAKSRNTAAFAGNDLVFS